MSRQSNASAADGTRLSFFRPLSLRKKSSKMQKINLADPSSSANRRQSAGGDPFPQDVTSLTVTRGSRSKFKAHRSLSVTQATAKGDGSGELEIVCARELTSFKFKKVN